jgi:succinate dehydrogenase / fumarate reductase flavoprotein subunit
LGEANFSDHGANRLGASALMQGLADGYFVIPYTIGNFLSTQIRTPHIDTNQKEFADAEKEVQARIDRLMNIKGTLSVDDLHKRLGKVMWDECGMSRSAEGLVKARHEIAQIKEDF